MPALLKCPVCGGIPTIEDGLAKFVCGSTTKMVVHIGKCSLAGKTEYVDLEAAVAGWNKDVSNWFDKNERSAKKAKNMQSVVKSLWGGE